MSRRRSLLALTVAGALVAPSAAGTATVAAKPQAATASAACPAADQPASTATTGQLALSVRCLIAAQRAAAGVRTVAPNARLARAATGHATDMVARRYFAHTSLGGRTLRDRVRQEGYLPSRGGWSVGEIQAWSAGAQATPQGIVDAWMNSPPHRRILLGSAYSEVGVGVAIGSPRDGANAQALTVVADFGSRR
jgi:uncharacterized protein YkwD